MRLLFLPAMLLLGSMLVPQAVAGEEAYLQELQHRARALDLAHERQWQDLLHYEPRRFRPGRRSATRHEEFFNAPDGYRDPAAELNATLAAFFADPDGFQGDEQHPQCAFIARRHWLAERLNIDPDRLPMRPCPRFRSWYESINPRDVTLVFADAHVNSPASMFGHTLLRIDPPGQDRELRLLSYVINHAAATTETSGLMFAVRGLTGGYPGMFSIMPYYEKVREYNALENRDLWEYELDLEQDEVDLMLMHVWEVGSTPFPYYFLYQNCSYRLLRLLDIARPGMDLSDRFSWWAIPTDTVRVVLDEEGLLRKAVYRPSDRSLLDHRLAQLSEAEQNLVLGLALGEKTPESKRFRALPAPRRAVMLELAHDYLHYLHTAGDADDDARGRLRDLLVERARVGSAPEQSSPDKPAVRPDQGHDTLRLGIGGGNRDGDGYLSLFWRPGYHDLLDPPAGYQHGAHISFFDAALRYDLARDRLELKYLTLVDIESLAPRDRYFRPWSWHVGGGLDQRLRPRGGYALMAGMEGGGGYAWALDDRQRWLFYAAAHGSAWASRTLDDDVRAGLGPRLDLLHTGDRWRGRLRAEIQQFTDDGPRWRLVAEQDLSLSRSLGVRLSVSREADFGEHVNRVDMRLHWYR